MTWVEITLFIIAVLVMLVGLAGVILPVVPGIPLIFGVALIYAAITDFIIIDSQTLIIFGVLTAVSLLMDWLATVVGVRKMGGSYLGMLGAFLGMIAGLIMPFAGIFSFIIGAFIGAFAFEFLLGKQAQVALRAGLGSFIGFLAGGLIKFVIGATMIGMFIWKVLF